MSKALLVQTRTRKKGYVYYSENEELTNEKLQVVIINENMEETGEKLLCSPDSLIAIGHKD